MPRAPFALVAASILLACAGSPADPEPVDAPDTGLSDTPIADAGDAEPDSDPEGDVGLTDSDTADDAEHDTATDAGEEPDAPPEDPWERRELTLEAPIVDRFEDALTDISGWATYVPAGAHPTTSELDAYGIGNGWVFGLYGMSPTLNTLHGLVGPTYERRTKFFGDYGVTLEANGVALERGDQWVGRSLSAPLAVSRADFGGARLETVDFAPATDEAPLRGCMLRVMTVMVDEATDGLALHVAAGGRPVPTDDGRWIEVVDTRSMVTFVPGYDLELDGETLRIPLETVTPEAPVELTLAHCTVEGDTAPEIAIDTDTLLGATVEAYASWSAELLAVELPSAQAVDLIRGLVMTLRMQTSAQGATSPMSQYTRSWARDNIGPVLGMLAVGGHEDVEAMMDYIYGAVLLRGDLGNSYDADLDLSALPAPPDWEAMPALEGRVGAETPSYMVWIYGAFARHTGRLDLAEARWGFLQRCTYALEFNEDHLLLFTGDETFRAAMNASFGLLLESPHHEESFSLNSTLLALGATRDMGWLAQELGYADDVSATEALHAALETSVDHFVDDEGCLAAYLDRDDLTMSAPFEDASLKVTWTPWIDGDADLAQEAMGCLLDRINVEPGVFHSGLHTRYASTALIPGRQGLYTGMMPGYGLHALTEVGHPDAEASFTFLARAALDGGSYQEYQVFGLDQGYTLGYFDNGTVGDYTAKFRPWEGGINLDAILQYLVGFEPNAREARFALRPHLPYDWPEARYDGLRMGDDRFDVHVHADGRVAITSRADTAVVVDVRWDAVGGEALAVQVGGEAVDEASLVRRTHFGQGSTEVLGVTLGAGEVVEVVFGAAE